MTDRISTSLAGLGTMEWVIIFAAIVLLFGARKLPELARSMGASISSFKQGMKDSSDDSPPEGKADAKRTIEHERH